MADDSQPSNDQQQSDNKQGNLTDLLDHLDKKVEHDGEAHVGSIVDEFNNRTFGPVLVILGLVTASPVGGIPGLPTTVGLIVLIFIAQNLVGLDHIWLPNFLEERRLSADKFRKQLKRARPWTRRFDYFVSPRLSILVDSPMDYVLAVLAALLACTLMPLELVPFAAAVPSIGIAAIGLAKTARDGLLALVAIIMAVATILVLVFWLPGKLS